MLLQLAAHLSTLSYDTEQNDPLSEPGPITQQIKSKKETLLEIIS